MVLFNYSTKELTAKVVYYGPGLCGKTTNLQWIHEKLPIKNKGKMLSLATETDRTLFFDFLPIEIGAIRGMRTRIQLYTVPGQVFYNATRRMVLKGADAIVFVCDSQEALLDANLESWVNLRQNLEANELDPDEIPLVFQYNKRDLPNALPIELLNEQMNPQGFPFFEAIAVKGIGVEDTLKAVTKLVFRSLSARYGDVAPAQSSPRAPGPPRGSRPPASEPGEAPLAITPGEGLGPLGFTPGPPAAAPARAGPGSFDPAPVPRAPSLTPVPATPGPPPRATSLPPTPVSLPPLQVPAVSLPPVERAAAAPALRSSAPVKPALRPEEAARTPADFTLPTPSFHAEQAPAPGSSLAGRKPQNTMVSSASEADELRRRIAAPGMPEVEEIDLEAIEELDAHRAHTAGRRVELPLPTETVAPGPALERTGAAEVEVPIDIHVAPGTTRISLKLKLVLNLKPR